MVNFFRSHLEGVDAELVLSLHRVDELDLQTPAEVVVEGEQGPLIAGMSRDLQR